MTKDGRQSGLPLSAARWRIEAAKVPAHGLELDLSATEAERAALAAGLDLIAVEELRLSGRLEPLSRGRFRLDALLSAEVVQRCVATLDPVAATIAEEMDLELAPPEALASPKRQIDIDPEADEPEPIEDGFIEIGRLVYETLSVALPPYPRSPAAESLDSSLADPAPAGPFDVLRQLRKRD